MREGGGGWQAARWADSTLGGPSRIRGHGAFLVSFKGLLGCLLGLDK